MRCNVFQKVVESMCKKVLTKKLTIEKNKIGFIVFIQYVSVVLDACGL